MGELHYSKGEFGSVVGSRAPGGDPIAAYWDCGSHYKYKVETFSPPMTGEVNKPSVLARGRDPEAEVRFVLNNFTSAEQT